MKKLLALSLVGVIGLSIAGCGGSSDPKAPVSTGEATENTSAPEETETEAEAEASSPANDITIAETEIYNNNGVIITATGIESDLFETAIKVTAKNDSDKNVLITARDIVVNGYMQNTGGAYIEVAAGKTAMDTIYVYQSELEACGISTVANMEFNLAIQDPDTWDDIDITDRISIPTSAAEGFEQAYDDSGELIYDENGIKVVCKGLLDTVIWDGDLVLYIENNSERKIDVMTENCSVDGVMVDEAMYSTLLSGTKAVTSITFINLEDLGITSVDEISNVEFSLRISDSDSWDTIAETDAISLNF